jgi:hypothetical protein
MASGDPLALMQADAARLRVVNGTSTAGLSRQVGNYFLTQGMRVVEMDAESERRYERTTIVLYGPKLYSLRYLITFFGIDRPGQIVFQQDPASNVEIEVRVGTDALGIIQTVLQAPPP